jgi:glycosyltransferase involved in cell wall biosynthesis
MKIACISASKVPSDTANSIQAMKACQALQQTGHQVTLLVPGKETLDWQAAEAHYGLITPFQVERVPTDPRWKRYDFAWRAVRRARELGADLVYAWPPQAALMAAWQGMPVLLELHGEPEGRLGPWVLDRFLNARGKKRLLPITQALLERIERRYGLRLPPEEAVIVPNGVDLERYASLPEAQEARRMLGLPQKVTAGYTGHMYPGRGMELLFSLAQRFPEVSFLWVGGRPEDVQAWQKRLEAQGLTNVTLTGFVENSRLPLYQAAADILMMPYELRIEGSSGGNSVEICSPMKMFEYMAAGRAILSSRLPVIAEVLDEGSARLAAPEDVEAWTQALEEMLADQPGREKQAEAARALVEQYTWKRRAQRALEGFCE